MSKQKADIKVNHQALPEHFRIINIIYDPKQNQMQVQGHLTDWVLFNKMMKMAQTKVEEHHNSIKK